MVTKFHLQKYSNFLHQPLDIKLALGIVFFFGVLVALYLSAIYNKSLSSVASLGSLAANIERKAEINPITDPQIKQFSSQDDLKIILAMVNEHTAMEFLLKKTLPP